MNSVFITLKVATVQYDHGPGGGSGADVAWEYLTSIRTTPSLVRKLAAAPAIATMKQFPRLLAPFVTSLHLDADCSSLGDRDRATHGLRLI